MFVQILDSDDVFTWQPKQVDGTPYESTFTLRLVTDERDAELRKVYTKTRWDSSHRPIKELDESAFVAKLLDEAIVSWTGIKGAHSGQEVPCTADMKGRLPEKWKAEILRLCVAKEGGEVVSADEEKKRSVSISPLKVTA